MANRVSGGHRSGLSACYDVINLQISGKRFRLSNKQDTCWLVSSRWFGRSSVSHNAQVSRSATDSRSNVSKANRWNVYFVQTDILQRMNHTDCSDPLTFPLIKSTFDLLHDQIPGKTEKTFTSSFSLTSVDSIQVQHSFWKKVCNGSMQSGDSQVFCIDFSSWGTSPPISLTFNHSIPSATGHNSPGNDLLHNEIAATIERTSLGK